MLTCIACSKQLEDGGDDTARAGTPSTKDAVKSLTSQIKDMVLKFSGAYRQCKPCTGGGPSSSSYRNKAHHHRSYDDLDLASDSGGGGGSHYAYLRAASSSSTPAWDFTSINREASDSRFKPKWIPGVGPSEPDVVVDEDNDEAREWMAQVEPGVHITFVSLPGGGNDLKRIRFSREMFNKMQAQRWWGENFDRVMELYNVQRFNRQALPTPPRSEDGERDSSYSRMGSTRESPITPPMSKERLQRNTFRPTTSFGRGGGGGYFPSAPDPTEHFLQHNLNPAAGMPSISGVKGETSSIDASRTTTSSRDEASISMSNASDQEMTEWVEQDEPGVYLTIRELPDGTRELRRVRFSRERFAEMHAKQWWEDNRERIQAQYL